MIVLLIILGIIAYFILGAILAGLVDDEDLDVGLITTWPIALLVFIVCYSFTGVRALGRAIANSIRKFFQS